MSSSHASLQDINNRDTGLFYIIIGVLVKPFEGGFRIEVSFNPCYVLKTCCMVGRLLLSGKLSCSSAVVFLRLWQDPVEKKVRTPSGGFLVR
jgi:hypothetical protein